MHMPSYTHLWQDAQAQVYCMTRSLIHSQTWPYFFPGPVLFLQFIEPCQPTKHLWEARNKFGISETTKNRWPARPTKLQIKKLGWVTTWTLGPCLGVTPEFFQQTNHKRWLPRKEIFARCILNNGLQCRINNPWKLTTRRRALRFYKRGKASPKLDRYQASVIMYVMPLGHCKSCLLRWPDSKTLTTSNAGKDIEPRELRSVIAKLAKNYNHFGR